MNEQNMAADEIILADDKEDQNAPEQAQDHVPEEAPQADPQEEPSVEQDEAPRESVNDEEIRALRGRVAELTDTLTRQNSALQRMTRECSEFAELFPDTPLSRLPRQVWEDVNSGTPLAAAYALYQVKQQRREAEAAQVNARNRTMSGGVVSGTPERHLSPGEVRQMTPEQVHDNYSKILESMKLWS